MEKSSTIGEMRGESFEPGWRAPYYLLVLFGLLAIAIAVATFYFYRDQKAAIVREFQNELLTIAEMKSRQISMWRSERIETARAILENHIILAALERIVAGKSSDEETAQVGVWLKGLCRHERFFNAFLVDTQGRLLVQSGTSFGEPTHLQALAREVLQSGDLVLRDFQREGASGRVHLGLNLPLRVGPNRKPFGALLLGIDPADYLYPALKQWPVFTTMGEIMLVRREGDKVVFLNDAGPRLALEFSISINRTEVAGVQAVLGKEGAVQALDYRGINVIAALRQVPQTPWHVIVKVPAADVHANILRRSLLLGLLAISLVLGVGVGLAFLWRRQQLLSYRERYEAERRHRELLGRYDYLSRFANDAILLTDDRSHVVEANDRALSMYGYTRDELHGMPVRDLWQDDADFEPASRTTREQGSHLFETTHKTKNGDRLAVEVSACVVEVDGKKFCQSINRDISERKRAEIEKERLELQLAQAQKMESIGRLAGGVAHDFNNHLTVITGYCNLALSEMAFDDPRRDAMEEVRRAGDRAASLTRQLLAFSRKQIVSPRNINLNDVIAESIRMLRRLIGEDIEIVTKAGTQLGSVLADPGQMTQVLMNLAVNARDAMPKGGRLIIETSSVVVDGSYAREHPTVASGHYVLLTFTDTGVGMSPETQAQIFEPFFTTKGVGVGTGLGLSTVYGIVRQSGGWIWVYSEPGHGTTFKIYLPRAAGEESSSSQPVQAPARGHARILVVEDDLQLRKLTVRMLRKAGYEVIEAADGTAALALFERLAAPIDLLLTDVVMPGMNGREVADRLVKLSPGLHVLYVSGYTANVIESEGVLDRDMAFLPKPYSPEQLSAKVAEVLQ